MSIKVSPLGSGVDHRSLLVDGRYVVRWAREPGPDVAATIAREARLLAALPTAPVPQVVASDPELGVAVLTYLPGPPLHDDLTRASAATARGCAALLRQVWTLPPDLVVSDHFPLDDWLAEAAAAYGGVGEHLGPAERRLVEEFLAAEPPPEPTVEVVCHNDLGAEHLLVEPTTGELVGALDWSDAALTDPARDLGLLYRDLGPLLAEAVVAELDDLLDRGALTRAAFYARCRVLEDLSYGLSDPAQASYARNAVFVLRRTFTG